MEDDTPAAEPEEHAKDPASGDAAASDTPGTLFRTLVAILITAVSVVGAAVAYDASNTSNRASDLDQAAQQQFLLQQQIRTSARSTVGEDLRRVAELQEEVLAARTLRAQASRFTSSSPEVAAILQEQAQGDEALARTTAASFFAATPRIGTDGSVHYDVDRGMANLLDSYVIYQQLRPAQTQAQANHAVFKYRKTVLVGVLFVAALFFLTVAEFGRRRLRHAMVVLGTLAALAGVVLWPLVDGGTI